MRSALLVTATLLFAGCDEEETPPAAEADSQVADSAIDTAPPDTTTPDTAVDDTGLTDTGTVDAFVAETSVDSTSMDSKIDSVIDSMTVDSMAAEVIADSMMADTAVVDAASLDDGGVQTCGAAPTIVVEVSWGAVTGGSMTPVTATLSAGAACSPLTFIIPKDGKRTLNMTKGVSFYWRATQEGSMPTLAGEFNINAAIPSTFKMPALLGMIPPTLPAVVANPAWNPATMGLVYLPVSSVKSGSTGACADKSGVTFAVTGHPEAVIKYAGGGTSTGTGGDASAWLTIETTGTIDAPELVTITAAKTGCTLKNGGDVGAFFGTGKYTVGRGASSSAQGWEIGN
jgi:hypothetical protein